MSTHPRTLRINERETLTTALWMYSGAMAPHSSFSCHRAGDPPQSASDLFFRLDKVTVLSSRLVKIFLGRK